MALPPVSSEEQSPHPSSSTTTERRIPEGYSRLHGQFQVYDFISRGRLVELMKMAESIDIWEIQWQMQNSILHLASMTNCEEKLFDYILSQSYQKLLHSPNINGDLPIHLAVRFRQFANVRRLLAFQPISLSQLETPNNKGDLPLHLAFKCRDSEMAAILIDNCGGSRSFFFLNAANMCPLYMAMEEGFLELAEKMLGCEVTGQDIEALRSGKSVFHAALRARNIGLLHIMFNKFGNVVHEFAEDGMRVLSYAAYIGFSDGVNYLLERFPDEAFRPDSDASYPIHSSCRGGKLSVLRNFLQDFPHTKSLVNRQYQNILHLSAKYGRVDLINHLLGREDCACLINMRDISGNTAVHLATLAKHPKVVHRLLDDERVNLTIRNEGCQTAADVAHNYRKGTSEERLIWMALKYAQPYERSLGGERGSEGILGLGFSLAFLTASASYSLGVYHAFNRIHHRLATAALTIAIIISFSPFIFFLPLSLLRFPVRIRLPRFLFNLIFMIAFFMLGLN